MDRESRLKEIAADNSSGSQAITRAAATLFFEILEEKPPPSAEDLRAVILQSGRRLLRAHPTMASLFNLLVRLLQALDRAAGAKSSQGALRAIPDDFVAEMEAHNRRIADHLFELIRPNLTRGMPAVLTHSASGSVSAALRRCRERGKPFSVICTESRPVGEGARQAADLARAGIPTALTTDALAVSLLAGGLPDVPRADLVVVGADAVAAAGVVNKAGTSALAAIARQRRIPCYVLAGSEKFLPSGYPITGALGKENAPAEILSPIPHGLSVINRYFDLTLLEELTGVISEDGLLSPGDLHKRIEELKGHEALNLP